MEDLERCMYMYRRHDKEEIDLQGIQDAEHCLKEKRKKKCNIALKQIRETARPLKVNCNVVREHWKPWKVRQTILGPHRQTSTHSHSNQGVILNSPTNLWSMI